VDQLASDNTSLSGSRQHIALKRAANTPQWNEDYYDVLADGGVRVGRIVRARVAPRGSHWFWTFCYDYQAGRSPTHGYAPTREAAMAALAKAWRAE
jgi:hypothetical protein